MRCEGLFYKQVEDIAYPTHRDMDKRQKLSTCRFLSFVFASSLIVTQMINHPL